MTTEIIISNKGPDNVRVAATDSPTYTIAPGTFQSQLLYKEKEVHIKEVKHE